MKIFKCLLLTASVALFGSLATVQAQVPGGPVNDADRTFLQQTSQRNAFEIIGGQLPKSHSTVGVVRKFGNRITRDNNTDTTRLIRLALRIGVTISIKPSADQEQDLSELGELFNVEFNNAYVGKEILTILGDIRDTLTVIRDGQNLQVRTFARNRLPGLYTELQLGLVTAAQIGLQLK